MAAKVWNYKNKECTPQEINELSRLNRIPPLIALLLNNRGIIGPAEVQKYIRKTLDNIHDPNRLTDMQKAAERIIEAIQNREKITVYGDYDVDGVTSTALLVGFLQEHNADVSYYIPNRESEGYGINIMAIHKIAKDKTRLLITVDCGITACGEVEFAKTMGMDVIITDHHLCKEKLPTALAVVNPKRPDCEYPFDALAGVGVVFKLVLAIAKALGEKTSDCFFKYVELAAVGTVADVVSLLDENRVIVEKGLSLMSETQNEGIKALLAVANSTQRPIDATVVAFMIAPRINASGRLGSANKAVELLLCKDPARAKEIAEELEADNRDRRICEMKIYDEAIQKIEQDADFDKKRVIVLAEKDWHHGVIGIVASKITEKYYRPTILISYDEKGQGKGSGRSVEGFSLFDALGECGELLTNFGGHAMAAGVGLNIADLEAFSAKINAYAKEMITEAELTAKIDIDCELPPAMVTVENAKLLAYMEPFGMDNPKPVFSLCRTAIKKLEYIGSDKTHLRLTLEKDGVVMNAVGFRMSQYGENKKAGDVIDVAFHLDINHFRGMENVQLILKDIR